MGGCASSNALPTATAEASPGKLEPKEEPKQQQETAQAPAQETTGLVPGSGRIEPRPTAEGDTVTAVEEVKAAPQSAEPQQQQVSHTPMEAPPGNHDASRTPMRSHDAVTSGTPVAMAARAPGSMTPAAAASPQMNMLGSVMQGSMAPHAGSVAFHTGQQYALTPGDARLVAASSMSMRPAASTRAEGDDGTMGQLDPTQVSSVQPNPLRPGAAGAAHAPIDSRSQRAPTSSATSAAAIPTTPQVVDGVPVLVVTDYAGATIASTLSSRRKVERMALWLDQTLRARLALPGRRWTDPQLLGAQPRQPPAGLPAPPPQPPQQYQQQAPHHQQQAPQPQQYQPQPQYHHAQPQPQPQPQQLAHHAMYAAPHQQPQRVAAPMAAGPGQPVGQAPEA